MHNPKELCQCENSDWTTAQCFNKAHWPTQQAARLGVWRALKHNWDRQEQMFVTNVFCSTKEIPKLSFCAAKTPQWVHLIWLAWLINFFWKEHCFCSEQVLSVSVFSEAGMKRHHMCSLQNQQATGQNGTCPVLRLCLVLRCLREDTYQQATIASLHQRPTGHKCEAIIIESTHWVSLCPTLTWYILWRNTWNATYLGRRVQVAVGRCLHVVTETDEHGVVPGLVVPSVVVIRRLLTWNQHQRPFTPSLRIIEHVLISESGSCWASVLLRVSSIYVWVKAHAVHT